MMSKSFLPESKAVFKILAGIELMLVRKTVWKMYIGKCTIRICIVGNEGTLSSCKQMAASLYKYPLV